MMPHQYALSADRISVAPNATAVFTLRPDRAFKLSYVYHVTDWPIPKDPYQSYRWLPRTWRRIKRWLGIRGPVQHEANPLVVDQIRVGNVAWLTAPTPFPVLQQTFDTALDYGFTSIEPVVVAANTDIVIQVRHVPCLCKKCRRTGLSTRPVTAFVSVAGYTLPDGATQGPLTMDEASYLLMDGIYTALDSTMPGIKAEIARLRERYHKNEITLEEGTQKLREFWDAKNRRPQ